MSMADNDFREAGASDKRAAVAQHFFDWASKEREHQEALKERFDPLRGVVLNPDICNPSVCESCCSAQALYDAEIQRHARCANHVNLAKERAGTDRAEAEVERSKPRRVSSGTRQVTRSDRLTQQSLCDTKEFARGRSRSPRLRYASAESRRLTRHHLSLPERMGGDVAAWQERAAQREAHARRGPPFPRRVMASGAIARSAARLHQSRPTPRCAAEETFMPKTCGGIRTASGRVVGVLSSFRRKQPAHRHAADAVIHEDNAKSKVRVMTPHRMKTFYAKQSGWLARRDETRRRLAEEANARQEENFTQECTFRPATNSSAWHGSGIESDGAMRAVNVPVLLEGVIEYKSPTGRSLGNYKNISELRLCRPRPSSRLVSSSPPRKRVSIPPEGSSVSRPNQARDSEAELDEQTLLDLALWWEDIITETHFLNKCEDDDLMKWTTESPFEKTIAFSTAARVLEDLLRISGNSVDSCNATSPPLPCPRDGKVRFCHFIDFYAQLVCCKPCE